jgi:uncharacterized protein (DUF302 family)
MVMACVLLGLWLIDHAGAETHYPLPGTVSLESSHSFQELGGRLEEAATANDFAVVTRASASTGAASRGVSIPGNLVIGVFRNDYAVRMLAASVPAGIEAPIRIYVTEDNDATVSVTYRTPTAVFAPYGNAQLDAMARELDPVFNKIVRDAVSK